MLRLLAPLLPPVIGNELVRTYTTSVGGIYVFDGVTKINFCLPNLSQKALFNGFQWHHQSDSRGFRNPPHTSSDVVLLGDSYIYGHGVEEDQTVASVLRRDYGWRVYNMARQGDSLPQEYTVFRLYYRELMPKKVILFPIINDFGDIANIRTDEEMAHPPELSLDYQALRDRLQDPTVTRQVGTAYDRLYVYRLYRVLDQIRRARQAHQGGGGSTSRDRYTNALIDPKLRAAASAYYRELFADLVKICRENQIELKLCYINVGIRDERWEEGGKIFRQFLIDLCKDYSVPYLEMHADQKDQPELLLPIDAHLSPLGHQKLAQLLANPK